MKVSLKICIEFESWFENEREPKTKEEWTDFFHPHLIPEGSILGTDDGTHQDMIAIDNYTIECIDVS